MAHCGGSHVQLTRWALKVAELRIPPPVLVGDLFFPLHARLLSMLRELTREEWRRPTACDGWSVRDVALHLLGGEIGNLSRRRDGQEPPSAVSNWDDLVDSVNRWNQEWVSATRRISVPVLLDLLDLVGPQMCDYFQSVDSHSVGHPVSWAGDEPAPVWLDLAREYTERWHHQQHIREAVEQPGLLKPRFLAPVLETFVRSLPRAFGAVRAPEGTAVTLSIVGPAGAVWTVKREDSDWSLYEGAPADAASRITIGERDAWKLFTAGLSRELARERVSISGSIDLGERIL